ncbi:MAG TPA: CDP-alcohol phosphatidyltransferase family protein [Acidimicrobiia bacterium]|jgi:CDP-diacylglycerol--glycerol-3-phosphate 3-phosphatidyltransferase|nr:CDP-alcohol phosphatidyltransferase family protein [Acidimicrobiia bacterium]
MLDTRWRAGVERGLRPAGARLRQVGISADQITLLGLAASVACGLAIATGRLGWGAFFLALSGLTDVLDGAVAKSGGTAGPRGAFFDSVCDRVSDGVVLAGAAWYYAGRSPHLAVLAFGVAMLSLLVSYERSRAESLGFVGKGGLMERAERMVVLGVGLTFGQLTPALWLLAVLTGITVVQRFLLVWRQATPGMARTTRPSWWVTAREARSDESRLAGWRLANRPPGERSRLANWLLSARPPAGEGDRRWWSASPGRPTRPSRLGEDPAGVRSQLRRLRSRTRP